MSYVGSTSLAVESVSKSESRIRRCRACGRAADRQLWAKAASSEGDPAMDGGGREGLGLA